MNRTNPLSEVRRRYDEFAPVYVETWSHLEGYSHLVSGFLERVVKPGCRVLDVGCGPGHLTSGLPSDVEVVGLDLSEKMIERAYVARPGGTYRIHNYYEPCPAELGQFDVVAAVGALDFCEDIDLVLRHLANAAKPGGRLLINVIERRAGVEGHDAPRLPISPERMPGVDLIFYSLPEMASAVESAGLHGIRYVHYKGYHNQYHSLDIQYAMWELERPWA
jgi:malonyl-CoA O-methyltransferase